MQRRVFCIGLAGLGWLCVNRRIRAEDPLYLDSYGLIVQADGDGGDSAQREGWAWFGIWIREQVLHQPWEIQLPLSFEETISLLEEDHTGLFWRHPDPRWNDTNDFSRDQQIPLVAIEVKKKIVE